MAVFSQLGLAVLADSDDEGGACSFDDVVDDGVEFIDFHDPFYWVKSVDEAEVARVIRARAAIAWAFEKSSGFCGNVRIHRPRSAGCTALGFSRLFAWSGHLLGLSGASA
jgi:hypothetical protein